MLLIKTMHDVFVSYEKETKTIADNIVNVFEKHMIRCWYAPRDVEGEYAQSIVSAIKKTKLFIIILNGKSSRSSHVLNEVETAYKEMDENGLIILPFKVSNEILSDAMTYYIKRFHWVDASNLDLQISINELLGKAKKMLGITEGPKNDLQPTRESNKYFTYGDKRELKRLKNQRQLLEKMSNDAYQKTFESFDKPVILDIGSNDGYLTSRILEKADASLVVGIDCDKDAVEKARQDYCGENIAFYQYDVESDDFEEHIEKILVQHNIVGFDIINISMVLLHLRNPFKTLKKLRKILNKKGRIIIRDIDDGFNVAYPDSNGLFKSAVEMVGRTPRWGYRHSGRQIYTLLMQLGFSDIKLDSLGLNTVNMSFDEREALFHTYFGAIADDLDFEIANNPNKEQFIKDRLWLEENIEKMEEEFYKGEFLFVLGFVIFTGSL